MERKHRIKSLFARYVSKSHTAQEARIVYSLIIAAAACIAIGLGWSGVFIVNQMWFALSLPLSLFLASFASIYLLHTGNFKFAKTYLMVLIYAIIAAMALLMDVPFDGVQRTIHEWFIPAICFCLLIFQEESKAKVFVFSFIGICGYLLFNLTDFGFDTPLLITGNIRATGNIVNSVSAAMVFLGVAWLFLNDVVNSENKLSVANSHIKNLMRKVFPSQIAERLEEGDTAISKKHDNVVVIFIDIVGFTAWCEKTTPENVVKQLDRIFKSFDVTIDAYGLCKIKTIGDAYLIAAGVPNVIKSPVDTAIRCCEDLLTKIQMFEMDLRIGVHCGEVVAGVVGEQRQVYDIWGDTVNTASRVESNGIKGNIVITKQAYDQLLDKSKFEPYDSLLMKGKSRTIDLYKRLQIYV